MGPYMVEASVRAVHARASTARARPARQGELAPQCSCPCSRRTGAFARVLFATVMVTGCVGFTACGDDGGDECVACNPGPGGMDACPDLCPDENREVRKCSVPKGASTGCCITEGTICE